MTVAVPPGRKRNHRVLPLMALALCAGIRLGVAWAYTPLITAGLVCSFLLLVFLLLARRDTRPGVLIFCLFFGMNLYHLPIFGGSAVPGDYRIQGTVSTVPKYSEGKVSAALDNIYLDGESTGLSAYWSYYEQEGQPLLRDGDTVTFNGSVYAPSTASNPGDFDFAAYVKSRGLDICVSGAQGLSVDGNVPVPFFSAVRNRISDHLDRCLGAENSSLAKALVIGSRVSVEEQDQEAFRRCGAAHLLALSGLHISILSGLLLLLISRLPLRPWVRFLLLAVPLGLYCAMTGFSASVLRAYLMALVLEGHRLVKRRYDMLSALSLAAILLLCIRPAWLMSSGFQMSFGAVLGICVLKPVLDRLLNRLPGSGTSVGAGILQAVTTCLSAQVGVLIPMVNAYGSMPLIGLLTNLVLVPLATPLLIGYYLLLPFGWVPGFGSLMAWATNVFLSLVHIAAEIPFAELSLPVFSYLQCALFVGCVFCVTDFTRAWCRFRFPAAAALALCFALTFFIPGYVFSGSEVTYTQLAVGQADCAVLTDGSMTVVIDTGTDGVALTRFLARSGRQVDTLILTHAHADHAGGLTCLLDSGIPVKELCLPWGWDKCGVDEDVRSQIENAMDRGIPVRLLSAGDELMLPGTVITVLWPYKNGVVPGLDANYYSLSMYIRAQGVSILAQGDLNSRYEGYTAMPADILKVSHHGSNGATGSDFLDIVRPRVSIISAKDGSSYLPGYSTLQRLRDINSQLYQTQLTGTVTVTIRGDEYEIRTFREE